MPFSRLPRPTNSSSRSSGARPQRCRSSATAAGVVLRRPAPEGTRIVSVAHCKVIETVYDASYGNLVKTELDDGTQIWYAHQSSYVVSVGEEIDPGQLIGYVGATGNVTGPHLHLEVRPGGGDPIDPLPWLRNLGLKI